MTVWVNYCHNLLYKVSELIYIIMLLFKDFVCNSGVYDMISILDTGSN